ncbi:uncharacterized protein BX663DRAFT_513378 [Cokeromyces recurvatus]|uniref:uncharacterized protein n=1 Tax=Cokeromyces recurvatus TaxID=90255 RepID=UPI00221E50C3|nr:uncharacterized protein BX663DRAFT_513378 [Cokeromyces recurvatus]KAI7901588.1 hypothetical protein BX663DRAFT_513378 [Cokeromyces recurvatus]
MGCCNSKNDINQDEGRIPRNAINQTNNENNINITENNSNNVHQQHPTPPIVVTKANSIKSTDSSLLPPSTSTQPINQDVKIQQHGQEEDNKEIEKSVAEVTEDNEPPAFVTTEEEEEKERIQEIQPTQSISSSELNNTTTEIHNTTSEEEPWTIFIRRTNAPTNDIKIHIPTKEPFMTVSDLKKSDKIPLEPDQRIKFIYLGRILEDQFAFIPASSSSFTSTKNSIKIANHGVIQAMIYKK